MNFAKFSGTPFLKNTSRVLLLIFQLICDRVIHILGEEPFVAFQRKSILERLVNIFKDVCV